VRLPLSRFLLLAGAAALAAFALGYLAAHGGSPAAGEPSARLGSVTVETAGVKVSALGQAPTPPALGRGERKPPTKRGDGDDGGGNGPVVTPTPTPVRPQPPTPTPRGPGPTPTGIPGD
jgi:hypothetical protein